MKALVKPAVILGVAGVLTLGSMTASDARNRAWIAGAAGFAVGAAVGAAAANASYYNAGYYYGPAYAHDPGYSVAYDSYAYSPTYVAPAPAVAYSEPAPAYVQVQYRDPAFAYTGDPAYRRGYRAYGYAPGYDAYAYAPGYRVYRRGGYDVRTRSVPRHYDPGAGYNSNTVAPWQDWKLQGNDY